MTTPRYQPLSSPKRGAHLLTLLLILSGCASLPPPQIVDLEGEFTRDAEIDRLRYFREINIYPALTQLGLTGAGVRVTIMGEMVDADHPDLAGAIQQQFNTFSYRGDVRPGTGNQSLWHDRLGANDGHGTHIAGTIAAACDGLGIQGVACRSTIDVYNLGAYDNSERFPQRGWGKTHELERFMLAFATALDDITARGSSRITTGSFNLESPAIRYSTDSGLSGVSATRLVNVLESDVHDVDDLFDKQLAVAIDPDDQFYLNRMVADNEDSVSVAMLSLLPLSDTWQTLASAIARYQSTDGVYLVTESNYRFDGRSSTLNALPVLNDNIDPELWLSVVMAVPEGLDSLGFDATDADVDLLMQGPYSTPLNTCGAMASEFCIAVPSYSVLSTMTERVAFRGTSPLFKVDDRLYQSLDGHSMGAPMVAGALALMEEHNIKRGLGYRMRDLVRLLKDNANRRFPGYNPLRHGRGLLDVSAAIAAM